MQLKSDQQENLEGRDLLTVLVKSNVASQPDAQMSEEEVLATISTFLAAANETTAVALAWALYSLATNEAAQNQLRQELSKTTDSLTVDEVGSLNYLVRR